MKVFQHINEQDVCAICGSNRDEQVVLVPIDSTRDGNHEQATQVHLDCLDLRLKRPSEEQRKEDMSAILYQVFDEKKSKVEV